MLGELKVARIEISLVIDGLYHKFDLGKVALELAMFVWTTLILKS